MINLCNAARTLKKAACLYHSDTKEEAVLSFGGGVKLRCGEQMRRRYLPAARQDNEDKS